MKYYFNQLQENYLENENVKLVNKAIHHSQKEKIIYKTNENSIGKNGIPIWTEGIATFDKKVMEKHCKDIPNYSEHLVEEKVSCISWKELIKEYEIENLDLLLIDTEGFDYEVIKMVDFSEMKPAIIRFEHAHLNDKDLYKCMDLLTNNGYKLFYETTDTTAYLE